MTQPASGNATSRRDFLKTSAIAAGTAATLAHVPAVHAGGNDIIKVGVIGCGGRGTGAADNCMHSAKGVEIVAVGDYFKHQAENCKNHLSRLATSDDQVKELGNKADNIAVYSGLDAYKQVLNTPGINYVILATSPGFRPVHLEAAVAAGKNVFTEKPVGVDGPGIRTCLKVYEEANARKLAIAAGTQRRHQAGYIETVKRIQDGAIGNILSMRAYWNNTGDIWFHERKPGMTDLDYQIYNWYHFCWLCGDHIVEQHVHNLDVINWVTGQHPTRALGMGHRLRRCTDPNVDGHIYNFFAIDYEYPNGTHLLSMCRQTPGVDGNFPGISGVSEAVVGTNGFCQVDRHTINGKSIIAKGTKHTDPYVQEHTDLIASIREGKPINELKNVAESTLTAIMGRMSAYTGKVITWEQALNSKQQLMPENLTASTLPVSPVPVPGKTPFI